jgi:hypothetical protein
MYQKIMGNLQILSQRCHRFAGDERLGAMMNICGRDCDEEPEGTAEKTSKFMTLRTVIWSLIIHLHFRD